MKEFIAFLKKDYWKFLPPEDDEVLNITKDGRHEKIYQASEFWMDISRHIYPLTAGFYFKKNYGETDPQEFVELSFT